MWKSCQHTYFSPLTPVSGIFSSSLKNYIHKVKLPFGIFKCFTCLKTVCEDLQQRGLSACHRLLSFLPFHRGLVMKALLERHNSVYPSNTQPVPNLRKCKSSVNKAEAAPLQFPLIVVRRAPSAERAWWACGWPTVKAVGKGGWGSMCMFAEASI